MTTRITISFTIGLILIFLCDVKAQSVNPDSAAFYFSLGKAELQAGRNSPAWSYFDKAAKYDPQNADIQLAIADICSRMPRKEATAITALETVCRLKPADYATQWRLAKLYFKFDQYDSVINLLPRLRTHYQETPDWAWMLGKSYYYSIALQNYGHAIKYLEIALKDDPNNSEAAYLIGRMYARMENYQLAAAYYKRTLEIDSTSQPSRFYEFAIVLLCARQFDASINAFNKALERNYTPRNDFFENMAEAYVGAGKSALAIDILKELLHRRPQDIGLWNGLADIYNSNGKYKDAIDCWDKVMSLAGPENRVTYARALYRIGTAYEKMGNTKDGDKLREQAIEMDPTLRSKRHVNLGIF